MNAVDTNVVVRFLTHDDPKQTEVAEKLFGADDVWLAKTVILETAWVLGSFHGFDREAIHRSFLKLVGIDTVQVEDEADVVAALALTSHGRAHRAGIARISTPPI